LLSCCCWTRPRVFGNSGACNANEFVRERRRREKGGMISDPLISYNLSAPPNSAAVHSYIRESDHWMPPETGLSAPLGDTLGCVHCKIYARATFVDAFVQKQSELIAVIRRRVHIEWIAIGTETGKRHNSPGGTDL